jgi:transcriptional regulator with XRE-family HTH domain
MPAMRYFNRLRDHREALRYTQWDVAKAVDITVDRYGRLEQGRGRLAYDEARRLVTFFKVEPDVLFPAEVEETAEAKAS